MELAHAVAAAKPGDTLKVPAGRYSVNLEITKPLTLIAMGQVVLDGTHTGSVIRSTANGLVRLSGFIIVGGTAPEAGGGICVTAGQLELIDCTVRFNKAPQYGGGGLFVLDAQATVSRCRFEANTGRQGGAILVDGIGDVRIDNSTLVQNAAVDGGGLRVKEGAKVELVGCTLADNKAVGDAAQGAAISASGTTTRAPTLTLSHCIVSQRTEQPACVFNSPKLPATLTVRNSILPRWCGPLGGERNQFVDAGFVMSGTEPYLLTERSPAVGAGDAASVQAGARDVTGRPRLSGGKLDLGAFAFVSKSNTTLPY